MKLAIILAQMDSIFMSSPTSVESIGRFQECLRRFEMNHRKTGGTLLLIVRFFAELAEKVKTIRFMGERPLWYRPGSLQRPRFHAMDIPDRDSALLGEHMRIIA